MRKIRTHPYNPVAASTCPSCHVEYNLANEGARGEGLMRSSYLPISGLSLLTILLASCGFTSRSVMDRRDCTEAVERKQ